MSTKIESQGDALSLIRNAVENAACEGPWMGVVFGLKEGVVSIKQRATWDFPKSKMDDAIALLQKDLGEERKGPMLSDAPLPVVDLPKQQMPVDLPTIKFPIPDGEPAPLLEEGPVPESPDDLDDGWLDDPLPLKDLDGDVTTGPQPED